MTICARTETSSAETGSSATMNSGLQGQRPGDADALALAAREGVRVAIGGVRGETAPFEQGDDLVAGGGRRLRQAVDDQRLGDELEHGHPRVQRGVGILEDELHAPAQAAQLLALRGGDVLAVEDDPARRRIDAPEHGAPDRGLARAGLADEAERLAVVHGERHVVDGVDPLHLLTPEAAAPDGEPHRDAVGLDHPLLGGDRSAERRCGAVSCRVTATRPRSTSASAASSAARKQATRRSSLPVRRFEHRLFLAAAGHGVLATRGEGAARRRPA